MKYFIDFEATQFSMEIISVGCVREDGQTFYALVAPKEGKITPFITNLTGITAEMVKTAMTPDSVFSQFYDWVFKNPNDIPEFIVWGDSDTDFAKHTCHHTETLKAKMVLGYICGNTKDYAKACKKNLKWATNHSLIIEFSIDGNVLSRSKLLIEDENDINEQAKTLKEQKIPYQKEKKIETRKDFRQALQEKNLIKIELKTILKDQNISKCKYLYYEWFGQISDNLEKMITTCYQELKKPYTLKIHDVASLIRLSYKEPL